jgi:hypothetical protein
LHRGLRFEKKKISSNDICIWKSTHKVGFSAIYIPKKDGRNSALSFFVYVPNYRSQVAPLQSLLLFIWHTKIQSFLTSKPTIFDHIAIFYNLHDA